MTADRWTQAVRQQLGLGRLLPLGGTRDGAWLAEAAAGAVLRSAARKVPGVRPDGVRVALADPEDTDDPVVPPPPGALPPGPLRVTADFAATAAEPLPTTSSRLRAALSAAAADRLGLRVTEVDLRVTALLEDLGDAEEPGASDAEPDSRDAGAAGDLGGAEEPSTSAGAEAAGGSGAPESSEAPDASEAADASDSGDAGRVARAVLAVPGVARLSGTLGRPVRFREAAGDAALPRRHVQVQFAVRADHRVLDVAREVRARTAEVLSDRPTVTVLVTAVE